MGKFKLQIADERSLLRGKAGSQVLLPSCFWHVYHGNDYSLIAQVQEQLQHAILEIPLFTPCLEFLSSGTSAKLSVISDPAHIAKGTIFFPDRQELSCFWMSWPPRRR